MKKTKKLLAVIAAVCLIMTQFAGINVFATKNWAEVYADFEALELADSIANGTSLGDLLFTTSATDTTGAIVADPAGSDSKVVMFKNTSGYSTNRFIGHYHGYFKGFKSVVSYKLYFPNENTKFRIWHDGEIGDGKNDLFATTNGKGELLDARSYGQILKYPAGHEKAGETFVPPVGEWFEVVNVIDNSTSGKIYAETWIDGVCMLPNSLVHEGDFVGGSYTKQVRMMCFNGSFYLDDYEDRVGNKAIFAATPEASIDDAHTGDAVAVDATVATVTFSGDTQRLMDTDSYNNAVSIIRGAFELSEGKDYTITNKTHKSFDIEFVENLRYGSEYTINVSDDAENLVGVSAAPATFTFKTAANPDAGNEYPEIAINGAKDGVRYDIGSDITFNVVADDTDGIAEIGLMVNDELVDFAESANAEFTLENLEEGIYTVYAYAIDASEEALTTNSESYELIVCENTPTEIKLNVADGEVLRIGGQKAFEATAYDADGETLSDVTLALDGVLLSNPDAVPAVGVHTLTASVIDSNGNEYTKEATFEYRPEYWANGTPIIYDYDTTVPTLATNEALKGEVAVFDEAYGNSYVVTASDDSRGTVKPADDLWSYYHDGLYTEYEFYVEDVDAFQISSPFANTAAQCVHFADGNVINTDGDVLATYEANKWYKVRVLYDTVAGYTYVDFDGNSFEFYTGKTGVIRPNYFSMVNVKTANGGAKAVIDNIKLQYINKYAKLKNVKATDANGATSVAGSFLPTSTKSLELVFDLPVKDWCFTSTEQINIYKNSVAPENLVPVTHALGESWNKGSYACYRSAIITPSVALEEGQKYIVVVKPGIVSTTAYGTTYSSSFWASLVEYEYEFTATSGLEFDEISILDDNVAVDSIDDIISDEVTAQLKVSNYSANDTTIDVIVAAYNGNILKGIKIATQAVTAGSTATITTEAVNVSDATAVKAFVWNGATDVVPYAPALVIE